MRHPALYPLLRRACWLAASLIVIPVCADVPPEDVEFFEKKIRPVLVQECYECHSAEAKKSKGGLRLDTREDLLRGGESGAAIVPGKASESLLIAALRHEMLEMPPKKRLPREVIEDFSKWVDRGGVDPRTAVHAAEAPRPPVDIEKGRAHWAFQAPVKVDPPAVQKSAWPRNTVDRFILQKLEQKGLRPVATASRRELIRRATFDLIGLPPTPEEVAAFEADSTPQAFEQVVERLLASPHYGERWARHWLDVARYAEDQAHTFGVRPNSSGFRYRDWVIGAFNADMPYDEFVRRQIAVDQCDDIVRDDRNQFAALGFFGLGAVYYKNSDAAKAAAEELDDRVDTLSRGFLGLTVSCARCHDHKFDPIPTEDYYSLAGVFQSSKLSDVPLVPESEAKVYDAVQQRIKSLEGDLKKLLTAAQSRIAEARILETARYIEAAWGAEKAGVVANPAGLGEYAVRAGLVPDLIKRWANAISAPNRRKTASFTEWFALCDVLDQLEKARGAGEAAVGIVATGGAGGDRRAGSALAVSALAVQRALETGLDKKSGVSRNGPVSLRAKYESPVLGGDKRELEIEVDITEARELYLVVTDAGDGITSDHGVWCEPRLIGPSGEKKLTEIAWKSTLAGYSPVKVNASFNGGPLKLGNKTYADGLGMHAYSEVAYDLPPGYTRFRAKVGLGGNAGGTVQFRVYFGEPADLKRPGGASDSARNAEIKQAEALLKPFVADTFLKPSEKETEALATEQERESFSKLKTEVDTARKASPPMYPVAHALAEATPANMRVFIRGNPARKGDEAPRRFLRVLSEGEPRPFSKGSGRRELAECIASTANPLTARVMVNRIWQHHFGKGLVATASNFGTLGERPSHPELLDYLAVTFMEKGWSVKAIHREILLSATYQLGSRTDAGNEAIDADNRFLWKMNRARLDVESWRDALLSVSGQLDTTMGGASVELSDGKNVRRTVYSKISRHALDSLLRLFDFPDANITSDKRTETTVPQQQLFVLNSPFIIQQARAFAARIHANRNALNTEARIHYAFQLAFGRGASADEVRLLARYLDAEDPEDDRGRNSLNRWERVAQNILASNEFMYLD